ncbi:MAG: hypothetical protein ACRDNI_05910 [Gaiellaceae bacterium]
MGGETVIPAGLEGFVEQARALRDDDRVALAGARRAGNEAVRADAWNAALELLPERATVYVSCWARIGPAFLPERLEELLRTGTDASEIAEWQEVARLARIAIDEALLALLLSDTMLPPEVRELYHPWKTMLEAAHTRPA